MNVEEFLRWVVSQLTEETANVNVVEDDRGAVFDVFVTKNIGHLLGKRGSTVDAIRLIMKQVGYNDKHQIKVVIHDETRKQQSS